MPVVRIGVRLVSCFASRKHVNNNCCFHHQTVVKCVLSSVWCSGITDITDITDERNFAAPTLPIYHAVAIRGCTLNPLRNPSFAPFCVQQSHGADGTHWRVSVYISRRCDYCAVLPNTILSLLVPHTKSTDRDYLLMLLPVLVVLYEKFSHCSYSRNA